MVIFLPNQNTHQLSPLNTIWKRKEKEKEKKLKSTSRTTMKILAFITFYAG